MDRNYFLSYGGKITLLLLLAAVGKINTKLISVMRTKSELSCSTDSKNHLQGCLADVSVHLCAETKDNSSVLHCLPSRQEKTPLSYDKDPQSILSFFNTIKSAAIPNKWRYSYQKYKEQVGLTCKDINTFYSNSVKLVDGFKYIIKIPDKLILSLILKYSLQF
ncbi:hypothetical protein [Chryseobacterium sp. WLY505]|uniref:hypothetical protein n=1 Tax=Chryseobacterium sp. WLY505 TaxID=3068892 RepID=UPI002796CB05|nr:hypothetical protein [Chryseobacterium sp. WLY505]MDQ1855694.1 hypothetical protein [Chryseobacterium sp. WLY505]